MTQVGVMCAISRMRHPLQPFLLYDGLIISATAGASAATLDHVTHWEQKLCWAQ